MNEKICRLCLKTICGNSQTIGEASKDMLDILLAKLNLNLSKETVICNECANTLQVFCNFKMSCIYTTENTHINNEVTTDQEKTEDIRNIKSDSILQVKCKFCAQLTERERLIALNESKETIFLLDELKDLTDLNLKNTEELLSCDTCMDSLQSLLNTIMNWMGVAKKISRYIEIEGTDANGHIELSDVQRFTSKEELKYKIECHDINEIGEIIVKNWENYNEKTEAQIVKPDLIIIKTENIDVKSEECGCDSFQGLHEDVAEHNNKEQPTDGIPLKKPKFKCATCTYETKVKGNLKRHVLKHRDVWEVNKYNCDLCQYQTKYKKLLKAHALNHKDPLELKKYKCKICTYESIHKRNLNRHLLRHNDRSNLIVHKCKLCKFETKERSTLSRHLITHKDPADITMHKCDLCGLEVTQKRYLRQHMLVHRDVSEVNTHKCDTCKYESKRKTDLKKHMLTHRVHSNLLYTCTLCRFETKQKKNLKQHLLFHKKSVKIWYKCQMCDYEAKHMKDVKQHVLSHNTCER